MIRRLAFTIVLIALTISAQARDVLKVGVNDRGSYPYVAGDGASLLDPPGLAVDLMRAVAGRLDLDIEFVRIPGLRVLSELEDGDLDGALLYSYSPDREDYGAYPMIDRSPDPTRRLVTLSYVLYTRSDSRLDWDGGRFLNLDGRIGANLNYSIVRDLRELGVGVVELRGTADSFRMLRAGRIVGVADHEAVADTYLAVAGISGIRKVTRPLRRKPYYLMLSHQFVARNPRRAEAIWGAIGELRDPVLQERLPVYLAGRPQ